MGALKVGCAVLVLTALGLLAHLKRSDTDANIVVSVNISDLQMLNDLARALHIEVGQVPVTVQVPMPLAARVCGVKVKELRKNAIEEPLNCDATTISPAFRTAVAEQLLEE